MSKPNQAKGPTYDAIVIGAGISGLYFLYRLRQMGMTALGIEAGSGVGGTWYWNRYPGARFDSESYSYGYSFSEVLLEEWEWSEHFSSQPETLRYLNYVADKFDLRRDIRFDTRVSSARFNPATGMWDIESEAGDRASASFLLMAVGVLSAPYIPEFPGADTFRGLNMASSSGRLESKTRRCHRHRRDRRTNDHRSCEERR